MMEVKMLTERFIMVLNVFKGFSSPVYALKPSCSQCLIVLVGVSEIMSDVSDVLGKYGFLQVIQQKYSSCSLNFKFGPDRAQTTQKKRGGDAS